ncbi:DUF1566 domain-containing protein [bacterium]|nr:DUF1566 domain-containing protein [bacterium]
MKKIFAGFALFTLFFAVSCGSSGNSGNRDNTDTGETVTDEDSADSEFNDTTSEEPDNEETDRKQGELYGECYPNATCNKGLVCDEENNICIKDPNGNNSDNDVEETDDDSDPAPEQPESEESDSDSDTLDSTDDADTSDSQSDDDADADSGEQEEPCTTIDNKVWWSPKTTDTMDWLSALNYCEKELNDLNKCGYSDWKLPTIDELKTLLKWRRDSRCKVSDTDDCLSFTDCWTCSSCCQDCTLGGGGECNYSSYYYDGRYSELGDSGWLWSSSVPTEYTHSAWVVNFNAAQVYDKSKSNKTEVYVRCVRKK